LVTSQKRKAWCL